jgi:uncharacterized membrane protein (UPF0182 family)
MIRREHIRKMVGIGSLAVSLMIGLAGSGEWMRWLQFRNGVPFGVVDPILGYDIGFYVFRLPLFDLLQQIGVAVVVVALIGSAGRLRACRRPEFHEARRRIGGSQGRGCICRFSRRRFSFCSLRARI